MKSKTCPLFVLAAGIILTTFALLFPVFLMRNGGAATGIIGGADLPMYWFALQRTMNGLLLCAALLGIAMIITSLPSLIFHSKIHQICSLKTSALALGLSAVGGLGLNCGTICYTFAVFNERTKHPIAYPLSLYIGILSLFVFSILVYQYFKARFEKRSIPGILYDVMTSILYLPAFFFTFSYLIELLSFITKSLP